MFKKLKNEEKNTTKISFYLYNWNRVRQNKIIFEITQISF